MWDAGLVGTGCVPSLSTAPDENRWCEKSSRQEIVNIWRKTTSGTTDDVKTITYTEAFYFQQFFLPIRRFFHNANVTPDSDCVVLSINNSGRSGNWLFKDPAGWFGVIALLNIDERKPSSVLAALEIAAALGPIAVISTPPLFELFTELGALKSLASAKFLVSSGAELDGVLKQRLRQALDCPVLNCYALSEASVVAVECTHGQGLHIDPSWADVHVDSAYGTRGEIVLTTCASDANSIDRFHTGDFAERCDTACPCGSQSPRLLHLEGKRLPLFHLPGGTFLDPGRLNRLLPPVLGTHRFTVHQTSPNEFTIALPPDVVGDGAHWVDVSDALRAVFPEDCRILCLPTQEFSKQRKFVRAFN